MQTPKSQSGNKGWGVKYSVNHWEGKISHSKDAPKLSERVHWSKHLLHLHWDTGTEREQAIKPTISSRWTLHSDQTWHKILQNISPRKHKHLSSLHHHWDNYTHYYLTVWRDTYCIKSCHTCFLSNILLDQRVPRHWVGLSSTSPLPLHLLQDLHIKP
jgi:hypothetical protein